MVLPPGRILSRLIGAPYKLGGQSKDDGFDCLSFIVNANKERGLPIPESYKGITLDSYADLWNKDRNEAKKILMDFIYDHTTETTFGYIEVGDIAIMAINKEVVPTFWCGNNKIAVMVNNIGARLVDYRIGIPLAFRKWIREQ